MKMLTPSQESKRPPEVFSAASHGWSDCVIDPSLRVNVTPDKPATAVLESRTLAALARLIEEACAEGCSAKRPEPIEPLVAENLHDADALDIGEI
jgi:hypothetical protein